MASRTQVTCDGCQAVRENKGYHLSFETGWYTIQTQWQDAMAYDWGGGGRWDFCSMRCLRDWAQKRAEKMGAAS